MAAAKKRHISFTTCHAEGLVIWHGLIFTPDLAEPWHFDSIRVNKKELEEIVMKGAAALGWRIEK